MNAFGLYNMQTLWGCQLAVHLICIIISILLLNFASSWRHMEYLLQILKVIAAIFAIIVFLWQFQTFIELLDETNVSYASRSTSFKTFQAWVYLEVVMVFGISISNSVWLLVRSSFRNPMHMHIQFYYEAKY